MIDASVFTHLPKGLQVEEVIGDNNDDDDNDNGFNVILLYNFLLRTTTTTTDVRSWSDRIETVCGGYFLCF